MLLLLAADSSTKHIGTRASSAVATVPRAGIGLNGVEVHAHAVDSDGRTAAIVEHHNARIEQE